MATTIIPMLESLNSQRGIILASGSPRRKELMQLMGFTNTIVRVSGFAENLNKASFASAADYCLATASAKGKDVVESMLSEGEWKSNESILISADTIVEIDNIVLEKPADAEEAKAMLRRLSGRKHAVHTGVAIFSGKYHIKEQSEAATMEVPPRRSFIESTEVEFVSLSEEDIAAYVATGEPFDKAGGYGIQGIGGLMVRSVSGCYFNVMGLPIHRLSRTLADMHRDQLM